MNKARLAVVLGLAACFYVVASVLPLSPPFFSFESCVIALFFPFITRRYRILITGIYQLITLSAMLVLIDQVEPLRESMSYKLAQPIEVQAGVTGAAKNYVFQGVAAYNWVYLVALAGGFIIFVVAYYALAFLTFLAILTQPYSVYFLYERLGLIRRLNGAAPFASPEWFRS